MGLTVRSVTDLTQYTKKGEKPIVDLCRNLGCSAASFYAWKKKYGDTTPDEAKRLRQLEKDNARLLRIVGQQRLEIDAVKEVLARKR